MRHPHFKFRPAPSAARFTTSPSVASDTDPTRLRVLVTDPDAKTRFLLSRLLQGQGFTVVGGATGRAQALTLLGQLRPHLLLVGSTMVSSDSLELVRQAKQRYPDLGVTVLTDMQNFGAVGQLLEHGAGAVLAAPVDSGMLFSELRRAGDRCIATLAARCILSFKAPESERHVRALPSQCDYPAGPQRATQDARPETATA
jgi:CheY-like chemotaxis protein